MASAHDALNQAVSRLQQMSLSQRLVIALGALLVGGSLAWLGQWSTTPEMTALLQQPLSADELTRVQRGLDAAGVQYRVMGSQVLVPLSANRQTLLAQLQQSGNLPGDTSIGFASLVKESNPWISQEESNRRWTVALARELEGILSRFSGVREARVFLDLNSKSRGFSREQPASSAGVTLIMQGGDSLSREMAIAAARLVAGAVRGLKPENVSVVDGAGKSVLDWNDEAPDSANGLHRMQRQKEDEIAAKIREQVSFDPAARISVQVVLDHASTRIEDTEPYDPVAVERNYSNTKSTKARKGGQNGVQPNTGLEAASSNGDEVNSTETEDTRYQPMAKLTSTARPAGEMTKAFAAINISHSYLASVFKRSNPDGAEPTEQQIQQVFDSLKERISRQVAKLVIPPDPENVAVDWHYDGLAIAMPGGANGGGSSGSGGGASTAEFSLDLAQRFGPVAGLSVLALFALMMMMRMAKQSHNNEAFGLEIGLPKEAIEASQRAKADATKFGIKTATQSDSGGDDGPPRAVQAVAAPLPTGLKAEALLEAQEVDEQSAAVTTMIDQVSSMVNENPDAVAAMVENWIDNQPPR